MEGEPGRGRPRIRTDRGSPPTLSPNPMVFFLAVGAAFSNALISVLQRMGVEDAKEEHRLKLSLLTHALRRGVWLAGFALMIGSFLLQALALHFGRLSQVCLLYTSDAADEEDSV